MRADPAAGDAAHRVRLSGSWWIWRTVCLRSTGFPVALLDSLAAPALRAAAEQLLDAEQARDGAFARAKAIAFGRLKIGAETRYWRRAMKLLKQGRTPDSPPEGEPGRAEVQATREALDRFVRARDEYDAAWIAAESELESALRRHATDPRLREAVAWQNPTALRDGFDHLLRQPAGANDSQTRNHAQLVARYLQRYCAKNDTIGFFGPVAWGQVLDGGPPATLVCGERVIARHETHFERWPIAQLAERFTPALRPWLPPRLGPQLWLQGDMLIGPLGRVTALSASEARLLRACDGSTSARGVARAMSGEGGLADEPAVFAKLRDFALQGIVHWDIDIPACGRPESWLRKALDGIEEAAVRERLLAVVTRLEADLAGLHAAAGNEEAVRAAYDALAADFETETGDERSRGHGQAYAGRTLAYHDCVRDARLELGPQWVHDIAAPLALVLDSARWFTAQLAAQFSDFLDGLFDECCRETAREVVPLDALCARLAARDSIAQAIVEDVHEQLHERWTALAPTQPDERRLSLCSDALAPRAAELFAADGPGWPGACHHSPDILLAAGSIEDLRAGRYTAVLGELHPALNTLMQPLFLELHPEPSKLQAAMERDHPEPELVTVGRFTGGDSRMTYNPGSTINRHVEFEAARSWWPRSRVLGLGALVVTRNGARLELHTRDGGPRFPAHAFFGPWLRVLNGSRFSLAPPARHAPRLTVDNLVVWRESWRHEIDELAFAVARTRSARYLGATSFARSRALPRWMFYRVPGEMKPMYLDWESPAYVEEFASAVRSARTRGDFVTMTEMLPAPDQSWLAGPEGARHTCELRIVAWDGSSGHGASKPGSGFIAAAPK